MNSKKVNWFFLTTILLHIIIVVLMVVFRYIYTMGIITNFVVSSGIILIPALAFLGFSGDDWIEAIGFHKIKWSSAGMVVLFTFLSMPLTTLINAFSMLFVDNTVVEMSDQIVEIPFIVAFFFMAVSAPVCEEIVFRGVVYRGYKRSGTMLQAAVFSALLFALGHMNFNQAAYAFVIGIMLILLVEATGSIWASILYHVVFNGYSVCVMYLAKNLFPEALSAVPSSRQSYIDSIVYSMGISIVAATVSSAIAWCVLVWIAKNENRIGQLKRIWTARRDRKGKMVTIPFVIAVAVSIGYMVLDVVLSKILS